MSKASSRFSQALNFIIKNGEITKSDLHRKTGIGRPIIDGYLAGDHVPGLDQAEKIAQACGRTLSELLGETRDHGLLECLRRVTEAASKGEKLIKSQQETQAGMLPDTPETEAKLLAALQKDPPSSEKSPSKKSKG